MEIDMELEDIDDGYRVTLVSEKAKQFFKDAGFPQEAVQFEIYDHFTEFFGNLPPDFNMLAKTHKKNIH